MIYSILYFLILIGVFNTYREQLVYLNVLTSNRIYDLLNASIIINWSGPIINLDKIFEQIIGKILPCREKSCKTIGCPKFFGYCETHAKDKSTDAVFNLTLQFIIRQMKGENEKERRYLFYQVMITLSAYNLSEIHTYKDALEILKRHL